MRARPRDASPAGSNGSGRASRSPRFRWPANACRPCSATDRRTTSMRIAIGQMPGSPDVAANLGVIEDLVAAAARDGAGLVVLPEYAMFKQPVRDESFLDTAESLDGPFADRIRESARRHTIGIAVGMHERIEDERRAYNSVLLVDAAGEDVGA